MQHVGSQNGTGDIRTDISTDTARQIDRCTGKGVTAGRAEEGGHGKGDDGQCRRVNALVQIEHSAVAGHDCLVNVRDPGFG